MDKKAVVDIVLDAINNVSPYAYERLLKMDNHQDIYLIDLGINSIDYVSILYDVMDSLNIEFALESFSCTNSLMCIVDIIHHITEIKLENSGA